MVERRIIPVSINVIMVVFSMFVGNHDARAFGYTVTNTTDSERGSLRMAINAANANPGGDPITLDIPHSDPGV